MSDSLKKITFYCDPCELLSYVFQCKEGFSEYFHWNTKYVHLAHATSKTYTN